MIPVSADIQFPGLGRCFAHTVVHNRIYLTCPATKTLHCYDVRHGVLSEINASYGKGIPIMLAMYTKYPRKAIEYYESDANDSDRYSKEREGWSEDLALQSIPTTLFAIVRLILSDKKEADDVQKVMADWVKIKVTSHKSDDGYFFFYNDQEIDLEAALNLVRVQITFSMGYLYTWKLEKAEIILDAYQDVMDKIFEKPRRVKNRGGGEGSY